MDEINAEGGAIQFELKYEDDQHDAEKGSQCLQLPEGLGYADLWACYHQALRGYLRSEQRGSHLRPDSFRFFWEATTDGKDNMFQMCFTDPNQGSASADYIAENKLAEKIAII